MRMILQSAGSFGDSLRYFRNENPALVLFSVDSPGVALLGTVEQMLSDNRRIPIVFTNPFLDGIESEPTGTLSLCSRGRSGFAELRQMIGDLCPFPAGAALWPANMVGAPGK